MKINLLLFEIKKTIKTKKNIVIIALLILIITLMAFVSKGINSNNESNKVASVEYQITEIGNSINQLPEDNKIQRVKEIREESLQEIEYLKKIIEAHKTGDWKKELEYKNILDENLINKLESGKAGGGEPIVIIKKRLLLNQELFKRNIEPVERHSTKGFYFMNVILNTLLGFTGVILFTLLAGDTLAREFEKGTIKLLFTQPIKRQKLINSKLIISVFGCLAIIITLSLIAFVIGSLISGTGTHEYPVLISGDDIVFSNLISFLLQCFILYSFVLIFVITLLFLISILSSSSILTISIGIIVFSLSHLGIVKYEYLKSFAHVLPFTYFETFKILDGSLAESLQNNNISMQNGLVVLTISIILTITFSAILIKRKDIL